MVAQPHSSPIEQLAAAASAFQQEFHRQLFAASADDFYREINRITGREVREAAAEVQPAIGNVVHAFTTGTMVQVFLLVPSGASSTLTADRPAESN